MSVNWITLALLKFYYIDSIVIVREYFTDYILDKFHNICRSHLTILSNRKTKLNFPSLRKQVINFKKSKYYCKNMTYFLIN